MVWLPSAPRIEGHRRHDVVRALDVVDRDPGDVVVVDELLSVVDRNVRLVLDRRLVGTLRARDDVQHHLARRGVLHRELVDPVRQARRVRAAVEQVLVDRRDERCWVTHRGCRQEGIERRRLGLHRERVRDRSQGHAPLELLDPVVEAHGVGCSAEIANVELTNLLLRRHDRESHGCSHSSAS